MNNADLVAQIRSAIEGLTRCGTFGIRPIMREAADRIVALEAWKAEALGVLREVVTHLGDIEDGNGDPAPEIQAARRLVEKEDGR